jgi:hypothetical protein
LAEEQGAELRLPEEHYWLAEVWLYRAMAADPGTAEADHHLRLAQVHATLATVGQATANRVEIPPD